jgi:hypothetical protein
MEGDRDHRRRVTLDDIFGIKPISFWQASGLILPSQLPFKANMHRRVPGRGPDPPDSLEVSP